MYFVILCALYFLCVLKQHDCCQLECIQPCENTVSQIFHGVAGQLLVCLFATVVEKEKQVLSQYANLIFTLRAQKE